VPVGRYHKLLVSGAGYDPRARSVTVPVDGTNASLTVRRDFAASSGGATTKVVGPTFDSACGPRQAIDNNPGTGWETSTGDDQGTPTNVFVPKRLTVTLPVNVDVSQIAVDPSASCGDGGSASTGRYRIDTSADDRSYHKAAEGTFTVDDRGRLNLVTPAAGAATNVRYVRLTMLGNQTPDFATSCPDGAYSGCYVTDLTELEVYGTTS
jgi:hypothetical protein